MGREQFDTLSGRMHTGDQDRLLFRTDIQRILAAPPPPLTTLSAGEHAEAQRFAEGARKEAERLLAGEETGDFTDTRGDDIHIRIGKASLNAGLQVDRWIKTNDSSGRLIAMSFQVFEFSPGMVILNLFPRDFNPHSNNPATPREPSRREANQDDLRLLTSALAGSSPRKV